jgi:predicted aspartyl protease
VSLELGKLEVEKVQQSQVNKDRAVFGTNSGYSKLPRHSRSKSSLFTVNGLINGNLVSALIDSGCEVECELSI